MAALFTAITLAFAGIALASAAGALQSLALVPALDPLALLDALAAKVAALGSGNSLAQIVAQARQEAANGRTGSACALVNAFVLAVRGQSGKTISAAQAGELVADATNVETALGC